MSLTMFLWLFLTTQDGRFQAPWGPLYREGMVAQFGYWYDDARPVAPRREGRR